jgi:hypothetical protein
MPKIAFLAIGIVLGAALGVVTHNIGMGMMVGAVAAIFLLAATQIWSRRA